MKRNNLKSSCRKFSHNRHKFRRTCNRSRKFRTTHKGFGKKNSDLQNENQASIQKIDAELQSSITEKVSLQEQIDVLKNQIEALENETQEQQNLLTEKNESIQALQVRVEELESEIQTLQDDLTQLQQENHVHKEEISTRTDQQNELQLILETERATWNEQSQKLDSGKRIFAVSITTTTRAF